MPGPLVVSITVFIVNYCCTRVLLYAKMLKETENEKFFCQVLVIGGISIEESRAPWARDGTGQDFLDPTVNFKIITGWPAVDRFLTGRSTGFLQKVVCSLFNVPNEKFSKGWGLVMRFLQKWLNFKTFFGYVSVWKSCFEQRKPYTK